MKNNETMWCFSDIYGQNYEMNPMELPDLRLCKIGNVLEGGKSSFVVMLNEYPIKIDELTYSAIEKHLQSAHLEC